MTSVLRNLQTEWNTLVPAAREMGIPRVRMLRTDEHGVPVPLETIAYRQAKLNWLKAQLHVSSDFNSLSFGVEIECVLPIGWTRHQVAVEISREGVNAQEEMYGHTVRQGHWKLVTDASIRSQSGATVEVVSPPLRGEDGFSQLRRVCAVLTRIGAKVNRSCGFHVHVGVAAQHVGFFRNLVALYHSAQPAIDSFMAPSRQGNTNNYCQNIYVRQNDLDQATTVAEVARSFGQVQGSPRASDRYKKLNLKSFWTYGTAEFRHHQGTVEAVKAENWVRLCLRMVLTAARGRATPTTLDELLETVQASDTEREYFIARANFFRNRR